MTANIVPQLSRLVVPMAVLGTFALARKYLPALPPKDDKQHLSADGLDEACRGLQLPVSLSMLAIVIALVFGIHALLVFLNGYFSRLDDPILYRIPPQTAIWWFLPGFAAITLCWEIVLRLWSAFGDPNRAAQYAYWSNIRSGFDATRILRWMAILIVLPIAFFTAMALPMRTSLRNDDIKVCGYGLSPCQTFRYADAEHMTEIEGFKNRDGTLTRRAGIVLDFKDGRRWSSANEGDFRTTVDPALLHILQEKIALPLAEAETEQDIQKR